MKENQTVAPVIDVDAGTVTFNVRGHAPLVLHMERVNGAIIRRAAMVGLGQVRIVDKAAVGRADKDGRIIPEDERTRIKWERMKACIEHLESGTDQWEMRARADGAADGALTVRAVAQVRGLTVDAANAQIDALAKSSGMTRQAVLRTLATNEAVRAAMDALRPVPADAAKRAEEMLGQIG